MDLEKDHLRIERLFFNTHRISCETKRCWFPRRCYLSGKCLWFKKCEVVTTMIVTTTWAWAMIPGGKSSPFVKTFWCDSKEFLVHELKK